VRSRRACAQHFEKLPWPCNIFTFDPRKGAGPEPSPTKTNQNQFEPKPNQNHLKPTKTKTITTGRIAAAGDGSVGTGFGAESHLRENVPLPCCLPRRPADCGSYQFTHEFRQGPKILGMAVTSSLLPKRRSVRRALS